MRKLIIVLILVVGSTLAYSQEAVIKPQNVNYTNEKFRDPFEIQLPEDASKPRPVVVEESEKAVVLPPLNVEGVIWGSEMPLVIIEGNVLKIGDTIKEVKILDIQKEKIEVVFEGKTFFVSTTFMHR